MSDSSDFSSKDGSAAERLQKIIAQAGIASRRDAEELISQGQVTVNGKTAKLGDKATLGVDAIKVKGKLLITTQHKVYFVINKPKNVIAMVAEDDEGRITLKDLIKKSIHERVFTVGRMDYTGEGAILLTNDGEMAQKILKSPDIIRRYHVKVDRAPTAEEIARLARGGRIEKRTMNPVHVRVAATYTRNCLIEISFEGMGSLDVRKYFENKGFFPERVIRVGIGHISVEKLASGGFKKLEGTSVEALLKQPELAKKQIEKLVASKSNRVRRVDGEDLENETTTSGKTRAAPVSKAENRRFAQVRRLGEGKIGNRPSDKSKRLNDHARAKKAGASAPISFGDGDRRMGRPEGSFARSATSTRPATSRPSFSDRTSSARSERAPSRNDHAPMRTDRGPFKPERSGGSSERRSDRASRADRAPARGGASASKGRFNKR